MSLMDIELYDFIRQFAVNNGFMPTIDECAEKLCVVRSTIEYHMRKLEKYGYITRHTVSRYSVRGLRYICEGE